MNGQGSTWDKINKGTIHGPNPICLREVEYLSLVLLGETAMKNWKNISKHMGLSFAHELIVTFVILSVMNDFS